MRKITSLLMALLFVGTTAMAQNYEPRNNGTKTDTDRCVSQVSLTSGAYGVSSYDLTAAEQMRDWTDKTASVVFKAAPGETVTVAAQTTGSWVHYSVFIDVDADGFTTGIEAGSSWKPVGDLVAYSFYNNDGADDNSGWNSVGDVVSGQGRNKPAIPAFAVPSVVGTYRMRIVQDWCSIDPAGDADGKFSDFKANRGQIIDVTLEVAEAPAAPLVEEGKLYTLECRSGVAHSTNRFIADNGTVIDGQSATPTDFIFEKASEDKYYIKSEVSGLYLNYVDGGIRASAEKTTGWTIDAPAHTPGVFTLTGGDNKYLNNNGTNGDASTKNLQAAYHNGNPPSAGNACSLWKVVVSITNKSINVGSNATALKENQWYLMRNHGRNACVSEETTAFKMANTPVTGEKAEEKKGMLFRLISTGTADQYYIESANGLYFNFPDNNQSSVSATPVAYNIKTIGTNAGHFYIQHADNNYIADGQYAGENFVCWEKNVPSSTGGNNCYHFIEVSLTEILDSFTDYWTNAPTPWGTEAVTAPDGMTACKDACDLTNVRMAETAVEASKNGKVTIQFTYTGGAHKLNILGVDLLDGESNVVYKDYHPGAAGGSHVDNIYTMNGVAAGVYTLRYFVCHKANDHQVDQTNGTITVVGLKKYVAPTVTEEEMNALLNLANPALAATGVGYPAADCAERAPLTEAVANANTDKTSKEYYETLVAALTAFAATENVQMPEDGKAYTFTNVQKNGTKYYWHYDASGVTMSSNAADATVYVCKDLKNGKYAFVNNEGKFMVFKGTEDSDDNGQNNNKGYIDAYDATYADLTIAKLAGPQVLPANPADIFGFVSINGHRKEGNEKNGCHVIKKDGNFDMADGPFFNDNFSSAFQLVEVEYPNKPVVNDAQGVKDVAAISTFCAPFATVAPGNVEVYIATSNESHYIMLQKVQGAVPANTGVVLVSNDNNQVGEAVTMVPATTEELADVTGNLLRGDAAKAACEVGNDVNAYVLGAVDGVAGFYPLSASDRTIKQGKAYLELDASLSAVKLYFGGDEATGIETVVKENANAPIFDLSGRRVVNVAKGGIYIQNGKKFIVK